MPGDREVADRAERDLADVEGGAVLDVGELAVFGHLAAPEQCPLRVAQRPFERHAVVAMALRAFAAPGERRGGMPAGRDIVGPQRARRPALLVDAGLELLGIGEMAPAPLQRE